jgi:DNA-binding transcriptional MerR regulator
MSPSSLPLLCRSQFRPGESLLSLLTRLTRLNCYGSVSTLKQWCLKGMEGSVDHPFEGTAFEKIASLTNLSWGAMYEATTHHFADVLIPPGTEAASLELSPGEERPLLPAGIAFEQLRPAFSGQFCPRCLEESAYHRVAWIPISVSVCLEHGCMLLDRCPDCWQLVTVQDIAEAYCTRCGCDLAEGHSCSIEGDTWGRFSQQIIQAWLGIVPMPDDIQPHSLPDQPPAVLCHILDGLRQSITGIRIDWKYLHHIPRDPQYRTLGPDGRVPYEGADSLSLLVDRMLTPEESYCLYTTAFKGLLNWPQGFYQFLRVYSLREVVQFRSKLCADLGVLYSQWLSKHWKQIPFVQDAFKQYVVDKYALLPSMAQSSCCQDEALLSEYPTYISIADAARSLGVSPKTVERLVEVGILFRYEFPACYELPDSLRETHYDFIRRVEVVELSHRWSDGISLEEVSRWLGLSESMVLNLVKADLLFAERGPEIKGSSHWMFSKQAVTECYYEVTKNLRRYIPGCPTVSLDKAAQILSVLGLDKIDLLRHVATGKLACYLSWGTQGLGQMTFTEGDVRTFLEESKADRGWVDQKEIARQMGVKESSISYWIESGLLSPVVVCGGVYYFDKNKADEFATGHIFMDQVVEIAGVTTDAIRKWVREGLLEPVSGPKVDRYYRNLFRREDVERLSLEKPSALVTPEPSDR